MVEGLAELGELVQRMAEAAVEEQRAKAEQYAGAYGASHVTMEMAEDGGGGGGGEGFGDGVSAPMAPPSFGGGDGGPEAPPDDDDDDDD